MAYIYPKFNEFIMQDDNYVISDITYRNSPTRSLDAQKIARKPGVKLLANEFGEKTVNIKGYIIASSFDQLRNKIDAFHLNVTRKEYGQLYIENDRYATAIVASVAMSDPQYAQDTVPWEVEFLLTDPFWYASPQTVTMTVASGSLSVNQTITISGSIFAEPTIKYYAPTGTGYTTISGIRIDYGGGEYITWSGTGGHSTLAYSNIVTFDYANQLILTGTSATDVEGVFSRWEPETTTYTVTFSGLCQGGSLELVYQPRYL